VQKWLKEVPFTIDPYVRCEPFENPLKTGDKFFSLYENRSVYNHYRATTEWKEFLGYVIKKQDMEADAGKTVSLENVCREESLSFDPGECSTSAELMMSKFGESR